MSKIWIVNASPVITLAKVDHLHLLTELSTGVHVPEPVARELLAGTPSDPARRALEGGWGHRVPAARAPKRILQWGLGAGESSVLAAAVQTKSSLVVLDDADARKCALTLGVPLIGTLGVVVRAKLRGLIPSAAEVLRSLQSAGLFLDGLTVRKVLKKTTGEKWP